MPATEMLSIVVSVRFMLRNEKYEQTEKFSTRNDAECLKRKVFHFYGSATDRENEGE